MATKLKRMPLLTRNMKSLTEEQMLEDVRHVLGYGVVDEALDEKRVADILKSLDIEPFSAKRVEEYKKEAIKDAKEKGPKRRQSYYYSTQIRYHWKSTPLKGYTLPVPAFALLRAAQVQRAINAEGITAHFEVEELKMTKRRTPIDPFMVLVVGRSRFYVDVWDEPKFEGRRTV